MRSAPPTSVPGVASRTLTASSRRARASARPSPARRPSPRRGARAAATLRLREAGVVEQPRDRRGELRGVPRRDEQRGPGWRELRDAADPRRDHRHARRHRLEQRERPVLHVGGHHEHRELAPARSRAGTRPGKRTAPSRPRRCARARSAGASGPSPNSAKRASGCVGASRAAASRNTLEPLDRREVRERADELAALLERRVERDAVGDHRDPLRRPAEPRDQLAARPRATP